jgi:hypothetical protein
MVGRGFGSCTKGGQQQEEKGKKTKRTFVVFVPFLFSFPLCLKAASFLILSVGFILVIKDPIFTIALIIAQSHCKKYSFLSYPR